MTTTLNLPSQRVMQKIGMSHQANDDFDHPKIEATHPLCRHVLYRARRSTQTSVVAAPETTPTSQKKRRKGWAELLARVFAIDMAHCPKYYGDLKPIAAILETCAIKNILGHLHLPTQPPHIAPARFPPQMSFT